MTEKWQINQVVEDLKQKRKEYPNHEGLRACAQYIENRLGQFSYQRAKKKTFRLEKDMELATNYH